jgi:hypothetical protein
LTSDIAISSKIVGSQWRFFHNTTA